MPTHDVLIQAERGGGGGGGGIAPTHSPISIGSRWLASTMLHLLYFHKNPVHILEQAGKFSGPFCMTWRISPPTRI